MAKITYENKVALNVNSDIADVNKCNASDLNEIKQVVNTNDDNTTNNSNAIGNLSNLNTTEKTNLVGAINEVNENDITKGTYSTTEKVIGTWIDGKPIYRQVYEKTGTFTGEVDITSGNDNLDTVISFRGYVITNNNVWLPCPCPNSAYIDYQIEVFKYSNGNFRVGIGTGRTLSKIVMILEYTKITD